VRKDKINPATRQIEVDLHLESCRLALTFKDPVDGAVVPPSRIASVTLSPTPKAELDRTNFVYQVEKGIDYGVIVEPKRGLYFETIVRTKIKKSNTKLEVMVNRRTTIVYVVIDRPEDVRDHSPNITGLDIAARAFSPDLEVKRISWPELHAKTADDIESMYHPFMLFSGGSFTEWFHYGDDATWRAQLDGYAAMIRSMDFPTLAVCGSHQFVAIAYAGWGAVGHMNNQGMPVPIQTELSLQQPAFMAPNPRVGEIGDYPIAVSPGASSDPLVKALPPSLVFSQFHRDMVLEGKYSPQFIPIFEADLSRTPVITPDDKDPQQKKVANPRCKVQGLKLNSSSRLLYTVQFHPERDPEEESDDKHGRKLLLVFFRLAKEWWEKL
jgi:GMP synthase-like glutamine amidotransferase